MGVDIEEEKEGKASSFVWHSPSSTMGTVGSDVYSTLKTLSIAHKGPQWRLSPGWTRCYFRKNLV